MKPPIEISRGANHPLLRFVSAEEQYGRHIIKSFAKKISANNVCDLGVGTGADLIIFKKYHPKIKLYGVDFTNKLMDDPLLRGVNLQIKNIEDEPLDLPDESIDVFIANQILEHTKEIFWINDQVARKLKVGGYFIIGLPNISSLHNRLMFLFGCQPTQLKTYSAHVRGFAHKEIIKFFDQVWPKSYELISRQGAQFYPLPKILSRFLCRLVPSLAFSNFYLFRKIKSYQGEFLAYPKAAQLETNFFVG